MAMKPDFGERTGRLVAMNDFFFLFNGCSCILFRFLVKSLGDDRLKLAGISEAFGNEACLVLKLPEYLPRCLLLFNPTADPWP